MKKYLIRGPMPDVIVPPLSFRERGGKIEGEVLHPLEIVHRFEPIDTLDGAIELVDKNGHLILLHSETADTMSKNEYPYDYKGIYFTVEVVEP